MGDADPEVRHKRQQLVATFPRTVIFPCCCLLGVVSYAIVARRISEGGACCVQANNGKTFQSSNLMFAFGALSPGTRNTT